MKSRLEKKTQNNLYPSFTIVYSLSILLSTSLIGMLWLRPQSAVKNQTTPQCSPLKLEENISVSLSKNTIGDRCYTFTAESGQQLKINSNKQIKILYPNEKLEKVQGISESIFPEDGNYSLFLSQENNPIDVTLSSSDVNLSDRSNLQTIPAKSFQTDNLYKQLTYNVITPPPFRSDRKLQTIVDNIVRVAKKRGLNTDKLSISLVDLNSTQTECCTYAFFADKQPRYPASIVKLFWMVVLFAQYESGELPLEKISKETLQKMIGDSDNEAASQVLDAITQTESGSALTTEEIKKWKAKRDTVNLFFKEAGYFNTNINQKTFPIPYLNTIEPIGRDKQIRNKDLKIQDKEKNPIRNSLTTYSVARLLYEIRAKQSISHDSSDRMDRLLARDLTPTAWKNKPYNAIEGFLGEGLPANAHLSSKMGWTFNNRNDAAIIASPNGKAHYLLVIFGDDKTFYTDKKFLPEVSRLVYQQMLVN